MRRVQCYECGKRYDFDVDDFFFFCCAAALRWLKEEGKRRQILLFTCHSREAAFFAGDGEVSVQRLTADA